MTKQEIIDAIKEMNVMELSELVKEMETVFGVSAAAPTAVVAAGPAAAAEVVEEQTEFDVVLEEIGAGDIPQLLVFNKIDRIEGAAPRHDQPHGAAGNGQPQRERVWISARDGDGLDLLREALAGSLGLRRVTGELELPSSAGRLRARLHELDAVREESHDEHGWHLRIDLPHGDAARLAAGPEGSPLRELLSAG